MSDFIHYTNCPICGSNDLVNIFQVTDHTVSREKFEIMECSSCSLRLTQDVPGPDSLGAYYHSENYISHTDTSRGFVNRLYKKVRKRTIRHKRKLIHRVTGLRSGHLLDVGSGTGSFANEMKNQGWEVTGIEPDAGARELAEKMHGLNFMEGKQINDLPAGNYDVITLWHVLEHVPDLQAYLQQLKKLLKEKGKMIIAVPNYTSKDADIYKEYWAAYDVPRHLYHFSPRSVKKMTELNGLYLLEYRPMWYDSFYISMLSNKYKYNKIRIISACWNGLRSNLHAIYHLQRCSSVIYIIGK